jgi:hypothetical protein
MRNMKRSPALRRAAVCLAVAALAVGPVAPAFADGPGYGGDAGQLAVSWEPVPAASAPEDPVPAVVSFGGSVRGVGAVVVIPAVDPELRNDTLALLVRGLGFRGKSAVEVRIGSDAAVIARADSAGALAVALNPDQLGRAEPGVSVMAVGRNQSGTEVTLFGSVPPVADGSGPMSLVPWLAAAVTLSGLALWTRRRHQRHSSP